MKRITFLKDDTLQVFRLDKTSNAKISSGNEKIVQSYTFSIDQFNYVNKTLKAGKKLEQKTFFGHDAKNCFDCPFSMNQNGGGCYTHKYMQYSGFVSMIKSIIREFESIDNIPSYNCEIEAELIKISTDRYVRFGSYGEPSLHPIEVVKTMTEVAKSWTGYTHQYFRKPEYAPYFMASVHNERQAATANTKFNYRSFVVSDHDDVENIVHCPASKEMGFKSNCSACGLCSGTSGTSGKGKKSVLILEH
jgi:hypothetical protein